LRRDIGTMVRIAAALRLLSTARLAGGAADPFDHLVCHKISDPLPERSYSADLGSIQAGPETGCLIKVPAKLACFPSFKLGVDPPPPGAPDGPNQVAVLCYKLKCPKNSPPVFPMRDQFGSRFIRIAAAKLLCAPVSETTTTTTTTIGSASTTTTSLGLPVRSPESSPCGSCPSGYGICVTHCGVGGLVCLDGMNTTPGACSTDADCPAGMVCGINRALGCAECGSGELNVCGAPCP
jgi:hypothetical protein